MFAWRFAFFALRYMDLSIIIVNYKSKGFTLNCLRSVKEADMAGLSREIIVVDNGSEDNTPAIVRWQHPDVKVIELPVNLGMGSGNNLGFASATGRYLVVMNPDTIAMPDTFKKMVKYMDEHPAVGVLGPKQFNPDKSVQDSCYRWHGILTPFYRRTFLGRTSWGRRDIARFLMTDFDKDSTREVDWLLGSFLIVRAEALKQVGGFDEQFFLYFEDTDWCRRFHQAGWGVVYFPEAEVIHNHSRLSAKTPWYKFFTSQPTRVHIWSWIKYLLKWGVSRQEPSTK